MKRADRRNSKSNSSRLLGYWPVIVVLFLAISYVAFRSMRSTSLQFSPPIDEVAPVDAQVALPELRISGNGRFLITADGRPFFWLGDTAWELFHRTTREEVDFYLQNRAARKFNVVQAVVVAEKGGLHELTPYNQLPFVNRDPMQPNEAYFQHVDYVVNKANALGMYVGMLPTWGSHVTDGGAVFNTTNARSFGEYLGRRYKDKAIVWILGGDRGANSTQKLVWEAMGSGVQAGVGREVLITYHPPGGGSSAGYFATSSWVDFNMRQNGHCRTDSSSNYAKISEDYRRSPVKPVIDGEPLYEDHPVCFNFASYSTDIDIRRHAYTDVFAGAFGHTYGHHSIWQFWQDRYYKTNNPIMSWQQAIQQPGGNQMQFVRSLMESRPFLTRVPDQSIVATPGSGERMLVGTRDTEGSYAMVYFPFETSTSVIRTASLSGTTIRAWWYSPRDGMTYNSSGQPSNAPFTQFTRGQDQIFDPPGSGSQDWVLVLDDAQRNFGVPGSGSSSVPIPQPTTVSTPTPRPTVQATPTVTPVIPTPSPTVLPTPLPPPTSLTVPGRVEAESFNNTGNTVGYFDLTSANEGGAYLTNTSVDIQRTTDPTGGSYNVGWTRPGEWLTYTFSVLTPGTYTIATRTGNLSAGGRFEIVVDSISLGEQSVPGTGAWQNFQTVVSGPISLSMGVHTMKVTMKVNAFSNAVGNFNYFDFLPVSSVPTPLPITTPTPSPVAANGPASLLRAVNMNGPALLIDGVPFQSEQAAGAVVNGYRFSNQAIPLLFPASSTKAQMLRSSVWGSGGCCTDFPRVQFPQVPSGQYDVYVYNWEDNNSEQFRLFLERAEVQSQIASGVKGTWKKLGPYRVAVSDGALDVTFRGGAANFSGIEIWQAN